MRDALARKRAEIGTAAWKSAWSAQRNVAVRSKTPGALSSVKRA
jgi:hypothetical protein